MVYRLGGPLGYFRGIHARVLYQIPSTAICWSTYEFFKYLLNNKLTQLPEHQLDHQLVEDSISLVGVQRISQADSTLRNLSSSGASSSSSSSLSSSSKTSSKSCELPISSSHHNVYNTFTLSNVHANDNVTTTPIIDVRPKEMIFK